MLYNDQVFVFSGANNQYEVTFGVLFNDDDCANLFEAIVGTLRAAKRKKIVSYDGELLLQGVHDNVNITLLKTEVWWPWHLGFIFILWYFNAINAIGAITIWWDNQGGWQTQLQSAFCTNY